MPKFCIFAFTLRLILVMFPPFSSAQAQRPQPTTDTRRRLEEPSVAVTECQGVDNCAMWTFARNNEHRKIGLGKWRTGEEAVLELESAENNQVVVIRTDVTGSKAGLTATYRGTLEGNGVGGTYTSYFKGEREDGHWYWLANQSAGNLRITECEGGNCGVFPPDAPIWTFSGADGTGAFGTGNQPLFLEHFDINTIQVRRTDTSGPWRGSAIYTGRINGNRISGEVRYFDPGRDQPRLGIWTGIIGDAPLQAGGLSQPQQPGMTWQQFVEGVNTAYKLKEILEWLSQ